MGINKLLKIMDDKCNHLLYPVPLSDFKGEYIAIDLSIIVHQCHSNQYKELAQHINLLDEEVDEEIDAKRTMNAVIKRISKDFVQQGIKPVIIVDGESPQLKKDHAGPKRAKIRKSAELRFNNLKQQLKDNGKTWDNLTGKELDNLADLKSQTRSLPRNTYTMIIDALEEKGYPVLRATSEAEELCVKLCLDGVVKAVFSTDGDSVLRKCPILIKKIRFDDDFKYWADTINYSDEFPETLGFDYPMFLDFCIMMGCDYNERVKGMWADHIREYLLYYRNIEAIEKGIEWDFSCLNYVECRKLLTERPIKDCCANIDEFVLHFPEYSIDK